MSKQIAPLSGINLKKQDPFATAGVTGKSVELMKNSYSLKDLILAGYNSGGTYESEVGQAITRQICQEMPGVPVPSEILARGAAHQRSDLSVGINNLGGFTVQTTVQPTIADALTSYSSLIASGITVLEDLQGNVSWPRWQSQFSPSGLPENTTILTSGETGTLSTMSLTPHRVGCEVLISRSLLAQASMDVEMAVQRTILQAIGSLVDQYAINGSAYPAPTGLLNTAENTSGSFADLSKLANGVTAGGAFTYAKQVQMKGQVLGNNVIDDGTFGWIVDPATWSKWSQAQKSLNYPSYLIEADGTALGHKVRVSNNLSVSHQALFGRFSSAVLGIWAISILSDPYIFASTNQVRLQIDVLYDFNVLYGPAIVKTEDAANQ